MILQTHIAKARQAQGHCKSVAAGCGHSEIVMNTIASIRVLWERILPT